MQSCMCHELTIIKQKELTLSLGGFWCISNITCIIKSEYTKSLQGDLNYNLFRTRMHCGQPKLHRWFQAVAYVHGCKFVNKHLPRTCVCDRKDVPLVDTQHAVFSSSLISDGLNKQQSQGFIVRQSTAHAPQTGGNIILHSLTQCTEQEIMCFIKVL